MSVNVKFKANSDMITVHENCYWSIHEDSLLYITDSKGNTVAAYNEWHSVTGRNEMDYELE